MIDGNSNRNSNKNSKTIRLVNSASGNTISSFVVNHPNSTNVNWSQDLSNQY